MPITEHMSSRDHATPEKKAPWWAHDTSKPLRSDSVVRRWSWKAVSAGVAAAAVVVSGFAVALAGAEIPDTRQIGGGGFEHRQTTNGLVGGCGGFFTFTNTVAQSGIVEAETDSGEANRQTYYTIVPIFGRFWDAKRDITEQQFWQSGDRDAPKPEELLYNQWDGDLVVYYTRDLPKKDLSVLRQTLAQSDELFFVVPWPDELGSLPYGRDLAFVRWNATQTCNRYVAAALNDFRKRYPAERAPGFDGDEPPVIDEDPEPVSVEVGSGN